MPPIIICRQGGAHLTYWARFAPLAEFRLDLYSPQGRRQCGCGIDIPAADLLAAMQNTVGRDIVSRHPISPHEIDPDVSLCIRRAPGGYTVQFRLRNRPVTHVPPQPSFFSYPSLSPLLAELTAEMRQLTLCL